MDYKEFVLSSYKGNAQALDIGYPIIGLSGESGEILERYKKLSRKAGRWINADDLSSEDKEYFKLEMGDLYWYLTCLGILLGITENETMLANIAKLTERHKLA